MYIYLRNTARQPPLSLPATQASSIAAWESHSINAGFSREELDSDPSRGSRPRQVRFRYAAFDLFFFSVVYVRAATFVT